MSADADRRPRVHTKLEWIAFTAFASVVLVLIPALNVGVSPQSPLHVPDYLVQLLGKFVCFAVVAIAIDLVWGFTGILSLGHGVFFALGGYAMGMYLMRSIGAEGVYRSELPDFMVFLDWDELPWYWHGFEHFGFAIGAALVVPGALAYVFGYFAFRSRIRGVYFSIITQALTFALMLLFFRNETGFGGNNGLTDFKRILGHPLAEPSTKRALYVASAAVLVLAYVLVRFVTTSKLGRVLRAVRDSEGKVMFCGYDPVPYKLFAWTLSACLAGLAGALYVPQVGIINPSEMNPAASIEMVIWVAVGGRATLGGPIVGATVVNGLKSVLTRVAPDAWLFALGALFIVVTLFLPTGLVGLMKRLPRRNDS
jgi:urea transport system permease protein